MASNVLKGQTTGAAESRALSKHISNQSPNQGLATCVNATSTPVTISNSGTVRGHAYPSAMRFSPVEHMNSVHNCGLDRDWETHLASIRSVESEGDSETRDTGRAPFAVATALVLDYGAPCDKDSVRSMCSPMRAFPASRIPRAVALCFLRFRLIYPTGRGILIPRQSYAIFCSSPAGLLPKISASALQYPCYRKRLRSRQFGIVIATKKKGPPRRVDAAAASAGHQAGVELPGFPLRRKTI